MAPHVAMPLQSCHTARANRALSLASKRTTVRSVSARAAAPRDDAQQSAKAVVGRREGVLFGLFGSAALAASPAPAHAGLFGGISEEVYVEDTTRVLGALKSTLDLTKESENRESVVLATKEESNKWVAKYRREGKFTGRPSYGNTYSVINAVLGHYNNFGADTLFPRKRLERATKEVDDAGRALTRGR
uniref:Uncharacterized protein n=1 Tax=Chloropicon laureae TaxID=464258 RepID=A0A7S2Z2E5_9CHLO|mmetsp:Transcript_2449/g.6175  ORF Transcript_2449/g.6175 Transcript_2449/m.6175 type:complete len:189 (+) Transcript_2449:101-667(+)